MLSCPTCETEIDKVSTGNSRLFCECKNSQYHIFSGRFYVWVLSKDGISTSYSFTGGRLYKINHKSGEKMDVTEYQGIYKKLVKDFKDSRKCYLLDLANDVLGK
jgi:hypothetical protein